MNILKTVKNRHGFNGRLKRNRDLLNSANLMTLGDLKSHFSSLKPS